MSTNADSKFWPRGHTYIIAEIGPNHDGKLERALELIPLVAKSGADAIKFQTVTSNNTLAGAGAPLADYLKKDKSLTSQAELIERIRLSFDDFRIIAKACIDEGITFLSTPFDVRSVDFLVELNVPLLKIPSGDITNYYLLKAAAQTELPLVVSTGMATFDEISAALNLVTTVWADLGLSKNQYPEIAILHCTSAYPTPLSDVNLLAMDAMRTRFNLPVGYSDHTLGQKASLAAVARGAQIIEKHITPDPTLNGPDHAASLPLSDLPEFVSNIREIGLILGDDAKITRQVETDVKKAARRAIVAYADIKAGTRFLESELTALRPEVGISPMNTEQLIGRKARRDYKAGEFIDLIELT